MFCLNPFLLAMDLIEYNKATLISSTARDNLYRKTLVNSFLKFDVVYKKNYGLKIKSGTLKNNNLVSLFVYPLEHT